jgi:hypothetical protein
MATEAWPSRSLTTVHRRAGLEQQGRAGMSEAMKFYFPDAGGLDELRVFCKGGEMAIRQRRISWSKESLSEECSK